LVDLIAEHPDEARALLKSFLTFGNTIDSHLGDEVWIDAFMDTGESKFSKTNKELQDEFMNHYDTVVDLKTEFYEKVIQTVNLLIREIGKHVLMITVDDLNLFFNSLKQRKGQLGKTELAPATIKRHFSNLSCFYKYLKAKKYIRHSPIPDFKTLTLKSHLKNHKMRGDRQTPTTQDIIKMANGCWNPRDKAVIVLQAKTGMRADELLGIEMDDINWDSQHIRLQVREKGHHKRVNPIVFFDDETEQVLKRWLTVRERWVTNGTTALFLNKKGEQMQFSTLNRIVKKAGERIGIHDEHSENVDERFTSHCFRHWFTTVLKKKIEESCLIELRGDDRRGMNSREHYYRIPLQRLREEYLKHIPRLWV